MRGIISQTVKRAGFLFASALLLLQVAMPMTALAANGKSDVCPNTGDGWTKYDDWADSKKEQTHDAGTGTVVEVCVKGSDGTVTYTADQTDPEACWHVEGIGTHEATVSENWPGDEKGPDCNDISHASFKVESAPETGSITIKKDAVADSDQAFHFSTNGLSTDATGFDLVDDATPGLPAQVFSDLPAGSYMVSEDETSGWDFDSVSCTLGADVDISGASVTIHLAEGEDVTCTFTNREVSQVDYCDPSQRPHGMSIAQWLAANQFDGSECFDFTVTQTCGSLDAQFTKNLTPYTYSFRYVIGGSTPMLADWEGDGVLPVNFSEDENGGSVTVTYYIVGPEKDYFSGFGMPNIWDGNGVTVEVDTDCEEEEEDKIEICHATAAVVNPYNKISVNKSAADGIAGNSGGAPDHYGEHNGPIFNPDTNENGDDWGDIIPPIEGVHGGLNWTTLGQAIYENDCNYPDEEEKTGSILGHKFNDTNGDGLWDIGEETLEGFTIKLYQNCTPASELLGLCTALATDITDTNGAYGFSDLALGTYLVCEVQQDGWMQTLPANNECWEVTITEHETNLVRDFGNKAKQPGRVLSDVPEPRVLAKTGSSFSYGIIVALSILGTAAAIVSRRQEPNSSQL